MRTPCNNICQIDETSRMCIGCGRTLREIGGWNRMSDPERDRVMASLPERLVQLGNQGTG